MPCGLVKDVDELTTDLPSFDIDVKAMRRPLNNNTPKSAQIVIALVVCMLEVAQCTGQKNHDRFVLQISLYHWP